MKRRKKHDTGSRRDFQESVATMIEGFTNSIKSARLFKTMFPTTLAEVDADIARMQEHRTKLIHRFETADADIARWSTNITELQTREYENRRAKEAKHEHALEKKQAKLRDIRAELARLEAEIRKEGLAS